MIKKPVHAMCLKQRHSALYASRCLISIFELSRQANVMYIMYIDVIIRNVETLSSCSSSACRFGSYLVAKIRRQLLPWYGSVTFLFNYVGWLCWGLTSQSTIFQSYRDGAIASWVINQYFRGVKCLAQGHNTAAVGLEPRTSRSGVRHSTTEPPRSPYSIMFW